MLYIYDPNRNFVYSLIAFLVSNKNIMKDTALKSK